MSPAEHLGRGVRGRSPQGRRGDPGPQSLLGLGGALPRPLPRVPSPGPGVCRRTRDTGRRLTNVESGVLRQSPLLPDSRRVGDVSCVCREDGRWFARRCVGTSHAETRFLSFQEDEVENLYNDKRGLKFRLAGQKSGVSKILENPPDTRTVGVSPRLHGSPDRSWGASRVRGVPGARRSVRSELRLRKTVVFRGCRQGTPGTLRGPHVLLFGVHDHKCTLRRRTTPIPTGYPWDLIPAHQRACLRGSSVPVLGRGFTLGRGRSVTSGIRPRGTPTRVTDP